MPQTYTLRTITFDDFKKIKHVSTVLNGCITCIGGKNAQGKTSFIQAVDVLLGGAKFLPDDPIRKGADCAVLQGTVETPVGTIIIRRVITNVNGKDKVATQVSGGPGMESTAPQRLLDELVGVGTRDALAFLNMKPKEQVDYLQKLLGLNFDAVNTRRKKAYEDRTAQNAIVDTLAKRFDGIQGVPSSTPDEEVSASDLTAKLKEAATHNAQAATLKERADALAKQLTDCDAWLNATTIEISDEQKAIQTEQDAIEEARKQLEIRAAQLLTRTEKLATKAQTLKANAGKRGDVEKAALLAQKAYADFEKIDTTELDAQLAQVDEINKNVRLKASLKQAKRDWEDAKKKSDDLTKQIEACDKEKRDRLAATQMPVEGLSFGEDDDEAGVLFNGLSLSSASDAEQRVVAIGLEFASGSDLKVKAIKDGSLLDDDALKHVAELVEQYGGTLFVERVGYGKENSFILEAGEEIDEELLAQLRGEKEVA